MILMQFSADGSRGYGCFQPWGPCYRLPMKRTVRCFMDPNERKIIMIYEYLFNKDKFLEEQYLQLQYLGWSRKADSDLILELYTARLKLDMIRQFSAELGQILRSC